MIDVGTRQTSRDDQMNDCRSLGSNCHPSGQSRKISIGIMVDSLAKRKYGTIYGTCQVMQNVERKISKGDNLECDKRTEEFRLKQTGILEQVKSPSNQTSNLQSSNYNQKRSESICCRRNGWKDGTTVNVEDFTRATAQKTVESDKSKTQVTEDTTENRTVNLRAKLQEILGSVSSPNKNSGCRNDNKDAGNLKPEQQFDKKGEGVVRTKQKSDSIETDSEIPGQAIIRPVTRSLARKRGPTKVQPKKPKIGLPSRSKKNCKLKDIFSFEERWAGGSNADIVIGASIPSRKNRERKTSSCQLRKACFPVHDEAGKQATSKGDMPLDAQEKSHGSEIGAIPQYSSDYQRQDLKSKKTSQEKGNFQTPIMGKTDPRRQSGSSTNGNPGEGKDNPSKENLLLQDNVRSPALGLKTPILSSPPNSTPRAEPVVNDVSSLASSKERFSHGHIHNLRTSRPESNRLSEERESSEEQEFKESLSKKDSSFGQEKDADGISDSSSEDSDFRSSQEGARGRKNSLEAGTSEKQTFMLRPIKRLCKRGINQFNDTSPASPFKKGTRESNWIGGLSEMNEADEITRAIELFAVGLGNLKSKMMSLISKKSSEILTSVTEEIHLQMQNIQEQIQSDIGKVTNLSKSKRKWLETKFEDQQEQLRLIHEKFKDEVELHLQDFRSTFEGLEAYQLEIKGAFEKQRSSHRKLRLQLEESVKTQLNDAQRKIAAIHKLASGKMLQLKHVMALCLKEGILS